MKDDNQEIRSEVTLNDSALRYFARDGFVVVKKLCDTSRLEEMRELAKRDLAPLIEPVEFEADLGYPGAPKDQKAEGGRTSRRLLSACDRDPAFLHWATAPILRNYLQVLLESEEIAMSQVHHNCIMTKHPGFSSVTMWHQDIRYWNFLRPNLVSVWLALGDEIKENGALMMIPGSHHLALTEDRLDEDLFLRPDLPKNRDMIESAVVVELEAGDVVFFNCNVFHAAGKNFSGDIKLSLVTTYHALDNQPIVGTRSATLPALDV